MNSDRNSGRIYGLHTGIGMLASGCSGYIEKPITPETFVAEVGKFISFPEGEESWKGY